MLVMKLGHPISQNLWVARMDPFHCDDDNKYLPRCFHVSIYFAGSVSKEWMRNLFTDERWWGMKSWDMSDDDMELLYGQ